MSGVTVPTMIRSMSSGVRPARSIAALRGLGREVGRRHAGVHDVPLADPGALHDPVVRGLDELLEICVGQQARRHIGRKALDLGSQNNPLPGIGRLKYS